MKRQIGLVLSSCFAALLTGSCASPPRPTPEPPAALNAMRSQLDVQALVMQMADEYSSALTEAMRSIITNAEGDPTARNLAQAALRNGMSSALNIATGPNPDAALLDLLILVSLQRWSFTEHWIPAGIPEPLGRTAAERLRLAEASLWRSASSVLSDDQQQTLRSLIDEWIKANPDRLLVSFVRFDEFLNIRNVHTLGTSARAQGLFREVTEATAAVDQARLLGERALWYAGRYPIVLGQQAELTLYRAAAQPEFRSAVEAVDSLKQLSTSLSARISSLDHDLTAQQDQLFTRLAAERTATIDQAKAAISDVTREAMQDLDVRVASVRDAAVTQSFDRFAQERRNLLDDLETRQGQLQGMVTELRSTIGVSTGLARELTGTAEAIDRVVARFDREAGPGRPPLEIKDVRDAAAAAATAAERLTNLLERTNQLAGSPEWDERLARLNRATAGVVDRAFWRALWLVLILLAGQVLIRFLPRRVQPAAQSTPQ